MEVGQSLFAFVSFERPSFRVTALRSLVLLPRLKCSLSLPFAGGVKDVQWQDVKVGDIVAVYDDELIPADILCLQTGSKDGVCYIKTTNLDGESNLKIRRPVQIEGAALADAIKEQGPEALLKTKGVLECEKPNADLHNLRVRLAGSFAVRELCLSRLRHA